MDATSEPTKRVSFQESDEKNKKSPYGRHDQAFLGLDKTSVWWLQGLHMLQSVVYQTIVSMSQLQYALKEK
jgi:hypothetical protein